METLKPSQKNMVGSWTRYVWLLECIFQEDVEQNYLSGLSEESQSLYEEYKKQYASNPFDNGTIETGNVLMNNMKEEEMVGGHYINQHDPQQS